MNTVARNPKQIGNIVRRVRKYLALNQAQLGQKAGVRQGTVSLIETGSADIKIETLLAVLAVLDLEIQIAPRNKNWNKDLESIL
jgi:HTH-type transcriptional regulator / antitoxin HipB